MNQFISLRDNFIGADGAAKIAEALKINGTVTSIKYAIMTIPPPPHLSLSLSLASLSQLQ